MNLLVSYNVSMTGMMLRTVSTCSEWQAGERRFPSQPIVPPIVPPILGPGNYHTVALTAYLL